MRLLSLVISDFRGFYGQQQVDFAADDKKRVTVLHGENGAGKTNFLNAIHWCITGKFTPRFQDQKLLVNKEAFKEGRRDCYVEILFKDEESSGGKQYRVRRSTTNEKQISFEVYEIERGNSKLVDRGESLIQLLLPPGLISWFFFDAEAIGSLELSGSEEFKKGLRKTLGFELIDKLLVDLDAVQAKIRREVASQSNDKQLMALQAEMDNIDRVLPGQEGTLEALQEKIKSKDIQMSQANANLNKLPQAEPIQRRRDSEENKKRRLEDEHKLLSAKASILVGRAAPALVLNDLTIKLEGKLEDQEVKGRLPAPYSDQLVKDILDLETCICGRPLKEGSHEAHKISELLKFASTGVLNQRISDVRYLIRDIERNASEFPVQISEIRQKISSTDREIAKCEDEIKDLTKQLQGIDVSEIQKIEKEYQQFKRELISLNQQLGAMAQQIDQNKRRYKDLKSQHESASRRLKVSEKLKTQLEKVVKLTDYIRRSLQDQEARALNILALELNTVLEKYLTKHYKAKINASNYAVQLVDDDGKNVGHSTGEGQVLKFAFIATVVALAAKKTQEKIQWMTEPTIAPLVLDAPFSALDPEYQGSVAKNLALQTTQLVLMISSAAWGEKVEAALDGVIGKRYLIISQEAGPQGEKPVKPLTIGDKEYRLNSYGAKRTQSILQEVQV
jgi:DNA sulfur modification protein DndD